MRSSRVVSLLLGFGIVWLFLTGCASTDESREIVLTFDGNTCQYDGPKAITEGEVTITLDNKTNYELSLWAGKLDEGRTWQDMLEYIGVPGSSVELPPWAHWSVLATKVPDHPNTTKYALKEGLYAINCCTCGEIKGPRGVWPGALLKVNAKLIDSKG